MTDMLNYEKPFQGVATFLKSGMYRDKARIGFLGVPFDGATSFRPGCRFGPNAIRQASMMLTDGSHPSFGTYPGYGVTDLGDVVVSNIDVNKSLNQITHYAQNSPFFQDPSKIALVAGGDHTITTGILRGIAPRFEDLVVLHFDAHCDTWPDHFGDPIGHGTWVRNVIDEKLIKPENIIQIGIRSPCDPDTKNWLPNLGGHVFNARSLRKNAGTLGRQIKQIIGSKPVYISFDIDVLDPAYAPGTGTPECGGLTSGEAMDILEGLAPYANIVGMDLVEVNPSYDPAGITALAGATMLWTVASMKSF